jgi:UPF0755 protein
MYPDSFQSEPLHYEAVGTSTQETPSPMRPSKTRFKKYAVMLGLVFFVAGITCAAIITEYSRAPQPFPSGSLVTVPQGATVSQVASLLAQAGIIRSATMLKIYAVIIHDGSGIKAGQYLFDGPQSALRVAYRLAYGIQGLSKIRVTIPEGSNSKDITAIISKAIPAIDAKKLLSLAREQEGYLFPDTYFFYQNTTADQVVDAMRLNFDMQTKGMAKPLAAFESSSKYSLDEIVRMASIVEKEATSTIDRQLIAGILWKRLAAGYPLQVDPPFYYILGKDSSQITLSDLATSSPYNLYKHKGLMPTAIDDPGLDALYSTVTPTTSKYWYYLSDAKGVMHYATTYDQHLANKAKYID